MYPSAVSSRPDLDSFHSVFSAFAAALETLSRACNVFDDVYHDSKLSTRLFVLHGRFMVRPTPCTKSNISLIIISIKGEAKELSEQWKFALRFMDVTE